MAWFRGIPGRGGAASNLVNSESPGDTEAPGNREAPGRAETGERSDKMMPFLEHLEEFRRMLLRILGAVVLGALITWVFSGQVLDWLISSTSGTAMFMKPQGAFLARLKVSLVLGLLLTLPYVFYKLWAFIGPGLLARERKIVLPGSMASVGLFYCGLVFSYFLLTPLMVKVLLGFGTANLTAQTEVHFLLDLVFMMGLASGLIFQLPLAISFLTSIGVVTPGMIKKYWRHALVGIFITAALLTPADPLSQVILAIPLAVLYLISYFLAVAIHRGKMKSSEGDE